MKPVPFRYQSFISTVLEVLDGVRALDGRLSP